MARKTLEFDPRIPPGKRYRLLSCHDEYLSPANYVSQQLHTIGEPFELMYDSGAFTAWSRGKEVVLDDLIAVYSEMLEKYEQGADAVWLISLDKIPGSRGRTASPSEIDGACAESDRNFEVLKKRFGERVLPVFHQNESTERLHSVAAMSDYICVSPRNDLHEASRRKWATEVHAKIPGKKTHGLAATGYEMMSKVPWTSVDSATWALAGANGNIFRDTRLRSLPISSESSATKTGDQHYSTLPVKQQDAIKARVEALGFTVEALAVDPYDRMLFNRIMLTHAYREMPDPATIAKTVPVEQSLFEL